MAELNRNLNLEEINADALLGIDALKNQTFGQKVVFWGMLLGGITENVLLGYLTDIPGVIPVVIFILMLMCGIAFGCNYTEDMTYGKYLYYFFFKPAKELKFVSTEDTEAIIKAGMEIRREDEKRKRQIEQAGEKEQKKLLVRLVSFIAVLLIFITVLFAVHFANEGRVSHHTVAVCHENIYPESY